MSLWAGVPLGLLGAAVVLSFLVEPDQVGRAPTFVLLGVELAEDEQFESLRFRPDGALVALRVSHASAQLEGSGAARQVLVLDLAHGTGRARPQPIRDYRAVLDELGPMIVDDFFYFPNGDVAFVGRLRKSEDEDVVVRVGTRDRVSVQSRPLGPTDFRGVLSDDRVVLGGRFVYDFAYCVVPGDLERREKETVPLAEVMRAEAIAAAGEHLMLLGYGGGEARSFTRDGVRERGALRRPRDHAQAACCRPRPQHRAKKIIPCALSC